MCRINLQLDGIGSFTPLSADKLQNRAYIYQIDGQRLANSFAGELA